MKRDEAGWLEQSSKKKSAKKLGLAAGGKRSKCGCLPGERSRAGMKSGRFERTQEGLAAELAGLPPVA
jgi:hypothetical protein